MTMEGEKMIGTAKEMKEKGIKVLELERSPMPLPFHLCFLHQGFNPCSIILFQFHLSRYKV
ncbi:unnamed protein product, partial [Prunus brigantina]